MGVNEESLLTLLLKKRGIILIIEDESKSCFKFLITNIITLRFLMCKYLLAWVILKIIIL